MRIKTKVCVPLVIPFSLLRVTLISKVIHPTETHPHPRNGIHCIIYTIHYIPLSESFPHNDRVELDSGCRSAFCSLVFTCFRTFCSLVVIRVWEVYNKAKQYLQSSHQYFV